MSYPVITFNTIQDWETYLNNFWVTNGVEEITAIVGNNGVNGAVTFVKKSPLNWNKATVYASGGDIVLGDNFQGVAIFSTITPDTLSWGDNFYNEYLFINMTDAAIPLEGLLVYYGLDGTVKDSIPANTAINIFKASNDLWVQGNNTGSGGGTAQKQPKTYIVGTTSGAPTSGTSTWQLSSFLNSYVVLVISRSIVVDLTDVGDGSAYLTKSLASDTLTINNYTWQDGDILTYILITP